MRVEFTEGEIIWAIAPPIGFAPTVYISVKQLSISESVYIPMDRTIVTVVRLLRSNHVSEKSGPMTWNAGCATPERI